MTSHVLGTLTSRMALRLTFFKFDREPKVATNLGRQWLKTAVCLDLSSYQTVATPFSREVRTRDMSVWLMSLQKGRISQTFMTVEHDLFSMAVRGSAVRQIIHKKDRLQTTTTSRRCSHHMEELIDTHPSRRVMKTEQWRLCLINGLR